MNLPSFRNRAAAIALSLGCALALLRCDTQVAGSSVTTGNPTEIQVSFTGDGQPTALTGRVELYGATQIPVPGFQPEPLATFEVEDAEDFTLKASDMEAIPDSLWPVGSVVGDSLVRFNLVVMGEKNGAIARNFEYSNDIRTFRVGLDEIDGKIENKSLVVPVELAAFTAHTVTVHIESLLSTHDSYLFIRGTGFVARGDSTTFRFDDVPRGKVKPNFIALWKDGQGTVGTVDSVFVYSVSDTLGYGGQSTVEVGEPVDVIPLPDSLKQ